MVVEMANFCLHFSSQDLSIIIFHPVEESFNIRKICLVVSNVTTNYIVNTAFTMLLCYLSGLCGQSRICVIHYDSQL